MKLKICFFLFILSVISFISCKKDSENNDNTENLKLLPQINYKYIIYLTNDLKFIKVAYYINDTLSYNKIFNYKTSLVEVNMMDINNNYLSKSIYYLNSNGIADSSIDSSYLNKHLNFINTTKYTYDNNGYLIACDLISNWISGDTISSTQTLYFAREIENGNLKYFYVMGTLYDYYQYNTIPNKLDISLFLGDFIGEKNVNLVKSWSSQVHSLPSTAPASSVYSYSLNSEGFVTEKDELYTSSYHYSQQPTKSEKITRYEYIFQ